MGSVPAFTSQTLLHQPLAVPGGLPSDRTLAVITFQRGQRAQAESWIEGLTHQSVIKATNMELLGAMIIR